jgi:hypothetical protein
MLRRLTIGLALALALSSLLARSANAQFSCNTYPSATMLAEFGDNAPLGSITPAYVRNIICSQLNLFGGTMLGPLITAPNTLGAAGFTLGLSSTAPASPQNGNIWLLSSGLFFQNNGATIGPITGASGATSATGDCTGTASSNVLSLACAPLAHLASPNTFTGANYYAGPAQVLSKIVSGIYTVLVTDPQRLNVNVASATATLNFYTSPPPDQCYTIKDYNRNAAANSITLVAGAGTTIEGSASKVLGGGAGTNGVSVTMCFTQSTNNWDFE